MRSLEDLVELAKPALDHEELVGIARTASSNTEAKQRALVFTKEQGLDERVAMSCRWLKMFRDMVSAEEFEQFVRDRTNKREVKVSSHKTLSKTEQYNLQLSALCNCADAQVSWRANNAKNLGFDPTRIEEILGVVLENQSGAVVCAHCPECYNFMLPFSLTAETNLQCGALRFFPIEENGFLLQIMISGDDLLREVRKEFWVSKIDIGGCRDAVFFETVTFSLYKGGDRSVFAGQKVRIVKGLAIDQGERPCIFFECDTDFNDYRMAREHLRFKLHPISP